MSARIIDGKLFAENLRKKIASDVAKLSFKPGLAVVLVGSDPASQVYVKNKGKMTREVGMESFEHTLPESTTQAELLALVEKLNNDKAVHGILVQLPLPKHIDENAIINAIDPAKDVDGFHVINSGKLATGQDGFVPCTPLGCLMLLKDHFAHAPSPYPSPLKGERSAIGAGEGNLAGLHAIVIGRSNIVGKPMAALLLSESCTVTIAHSKTKDLPALVKTADIVVAAVGRPEMVRGAWIKPGAVIIDVGINRVDGKLVGDVAFDECKAVASAITPVPGGVGPMTIAVLLANTLKAATT